MREVDASHVQNTGKMKHKYGLRGRSIVIGVAAAVLFAWFNTSTHFVNKSSTTFEFVPSPQGLFTIALLFIVMRAFRLDTTRLGLSPTDLAFIYITIAFTTIFTQDPFSSLVFSMAQLPTLALMEPETYGKAMEGMSKIICPGSMTSLENFWFGGAPVIWGDWIGPMIFWGLVILGFVFLFVSIGSIFYVRWLVEERLGFSLTTPVTTVCNASTVGDLSVNRTTAPLFMGMIVPAFMSILGMLHTYFPAIPTIPVRLNLESYFPDGPVKIGLAAFPGTIIYFPPYAVAAAFLAPLDFSFSVVAMYALQRLCFVYVSLQGISFQSAVDTQFLQASGGIIGVTFYVLWLSRTYLAQYFRMAVRPTTQLAKHWETAPFSPRATLVIGAVSFILLVIALTIFVSVKLWVAVLFLSLFVIWVIFYGRLRTEGGLPISMSDGPNRRFYAPLLGGSTIGQTSYLGLQFFHYAWSLSFVGAWTMESFMVADECQAKKKHVLLPIVIGVVIAVVVGAVVGLNAIHSVGGTNVYWQVYGVVGMVLPGSQFSDEFRSPTAVFQAVLGIVISLFMGILRAKFLWWPFHPLAYSVGWDMNLGWRFAGACFVAWIIKSLTMRYGGVKLYNQVRPFFLGMFISAIIFNVVGALLTTFIGLF